MNVWNVPKYILENGWLNQFKGTLMGIFLQMVEHFSNHFFAVANIYKNVEPKWEQVVKMLQSLKFQYFSNNTVLWPHCTSLFCRFTLKLKYLSAF